MHSDTGLQDLSKWKHRPMHIFVLFCFRPEHVVQMQSMPADFHLPIETEPPLLFGLFRPGRFFVGVLFF